jgi:hypothetical protein
MVNVSLNQLNQKWENQLETCNYVGEICLHEDDLSNLSDMFKESKNFFIKPIHYRSAILVAAVNCAYYYYDDKGFWHHFTKLTGYENTLEIGSMIEKTLKELGLIALERSGPFRYVGVILEQCGISKRYFLTYAGILRHLKSTLGNDFGNITNESLKKIIEQIHCQKYLKNFLIDPSGIQFTAQVCNLLAMFEEGWINEEELLQLKGFMPGFWEFLIKEFSVKIIHNLQDRSIDATYPKPILFNGERLGDIKLPNNDYITGHDGPRVQQNRNQKDTDVSVTIHWKDPGEFLFEYHTELEDVFTDNIPPIEISDFTPIRSGRTGMFYEIGFDKGRIRSEKDLIQLRERVKKKGMVKGRIWTQVFERTRLAEQEIRSELTFIVIPNVFKNLPRLLGNADFIFSAPANSEGSHCRVNLNQCTLLDSGKRVWKIPAHLTELSGTIQSSTVKIGFNIPLKRITLTINEESVKYLEMKMVQMKPEIALKTIPNSNIQVMVNQTTLKITSDETGFSVIPSAWFQNISNMDEGIFSISININETILPTGTYLIEFENFKRMLLSETISKKDTEDTNINGIYALTNFIINNPGKTIKINGVPHMFEEMDQWLRKLFCCAAIFDNTKFIIGDQEVNWLDEIKSNSVKTHFQKLEQRKFEQIESKAIDFPMIDRWDKMLHDWINKSTNAGRLHLLMDWSSDIRKRRKLGMTSELTKDPGVKEISKAWIHYLNEKPKQALTILENSSIQSDFGQGLAVILIALIYLREARLNPALTKLEKPLVIGELEQVREFLYSLVYSIHYNKEKIIYPKSKDNLLDMVETLPFNEKDQILLKNYFTFLSSKEIWDETNIDWLSLMGRLFILNKLDIKELQHSVLHIKSRINHIPASPERADILEKIDQIV